MRKRAEGKLKIGDGEVPEELPVASMDVNDKMNIWKRRNFTLVQTLCESGSSKPNICVRVMAVPRGLPFGMYTSSFSPSPSPYGTLSKVCARPRARSVPALTQPRTYNLTHRGWNICIGRSKSQDNTQYVHHLRLPECTVTYSCFKYYNPTIQKEMYS